MRHTPFVRRIRSSLALLSLAALQSAPAAPPNIVFVLSDDHSAAFVGCFGKAEIRTPNLDKFAAEGVRFERAYVACPQCVPSRAALMTGRSPVAIQMTRFSAALPREVPAAPDLLRKAGYYTGIVGRTYHLDGSEGPTPETNAVMEKHGLRTFKDRVDFLHKGSQEEGLQKMEEFFDQAPKGKPFFLWVGFSDPHRTLDKNAIPQPHDPASLKLPPYVPDTQLLREDLARYCDEVARADRDFGRVLAAIERHGHTGDTLVIFMGDNGGALIRGKGTLYETGIRVPLIARWPGNPKPGRVCRDLISGEDITPTFLDAAGTEIPGSMTGRSFAPVIRGEGAYAPREFIFAERGPHGSGLPTNSAAFDLGRAVVSPTHKLIYNAIWQIPYSPVDFSGDAFWKEIEGMHDAGKLDPKIDELLFRPQRPMFELFDLANDPHEMNDLVGKPEAAKVEHALKAALQDWMILERDHIPLPIPTVRGKAKGAGKKKRL
ncbi:MAG TPA: sulfatase [Verrucomicrobiae bacterium]|nr:sulfatase [Verrucomicrobiae bacterium]